MRYIHTTNMNYGELSENVINSGQAEPQTHDDAELVHDEGQAVEMAYAEKIARE